MKRPQNGYSQKKKRAPLAGMPFVRTLRVSLTRKIEFIESATVTRLRTSDRSALPGAHRKLSSNQKRSLACRYY